MFIIVNTGQNIIIIKNLKHLHKYYLDKHKLNS
jgi:hypothetical protein